MWLVASVNVRRQTEQASVIGNAGTETDDALVDMLQKLKHSS
jgi:hypothetical protein